MSISMVYSHLHRFQGIRRHSHQFSTNLLIIPLFVSLRDSSFTSQTLATISFVSSHHVIFTLIIFASRDSPLAFTVIACLSTRNTLADPPSHCYSYRISMPINDRHPVVSRNPANLSRPGSKKRERPSISFLPLSPCQQIHPCRSFLHFCAFALLRSSFPPPLLSFTPAATATYTQGPLVLQLPSQDEA